MQTIGNFNTRNREMTTPQQAPSSIKQPNDEVSNSKEKEPVVMYELKKNLLVLATLAATVTYAAGLNLPGGSWQEDMPALGQLAGDSILRETSYTRYIVFYCFNAIAFAASLVVSFLLLLVHREGGQRKLVVTMRTVMVVDLLALMGAYAVGASHDTFTTVCASVLVSAVFIYVAVTFLSYVKLKLVRHHQGMTTTSSRTRGADADVVVVPAAAAAAVEPPPVVVVVDEQHDMLMELAIFAAAIAYVAGLNPPGGFWRSGAAAGDPVLQGLHPHRYKAFFFCNTTAFVASLFVVMLVVDSQRLNRHKRFSVYALYGFVVTALLGLGGAYAAGSCRDSKHTAYVVALVAPVLACKFLPYIPLVKERYGSCCANLINSLQGIMPQSSGYDDLEKTREYIQLLATLAATIAYQAGVDPPGGVWSEKGPGHRVGDPILLTTHPGRYMVFYYSNSAAFVASVVIMVMLQNERLVRRHALEAAIILDLFGLIGAYAAGSSRDTSTSVYVVAMAGGVLVYVVIHIVLTTLDPDTMRGEEAENLEKKREVLLLLAILAATLTYQAGLTPPGGFWEKDDIGDHQRRRHQAGFPVLKDESPRRYEAFFYCNAASFMASVALIVLLLNENLYKPGIRCYALYVCMVAGMFGVLAAYSAGSSLHLRTSIVVFGLVLATLATAVILVVVYLINFERQRQRQQQQQQVPPPPVPNNNADSRPANHGDAGDDITSWRKEQAQAQMKYLMLAGILAASATYLTGLKPPGGLWGDDGNGGHSAGNPVLYDIDRRRYNAFFYGNSTSFMASITIIVLLLRPFLHTSKSTSAGGDDNGGPESSRRSIPLWPMHTAMLLNMLAFLGAYAAGSAREWATSGIVILQLFPILLLVWILFVGMKKLKSCLIDPCL